jgi:hypothetical protein
MKYRPAVGISIWIGGTIIAFVLAFNQIFDRYIVAMIGLGSFIVPFIWSQLGH